MGQVDALGRMVVQDIFPFFVENVFIYGVLWISSTIYHITFQRGCKGSSREDHIGHWQEVLKVLKGNLFIAQIRTKQVDQYHSESDFIVGDWVFVGLQPYK